LLFDPERPDQIGALVRRLKDDPDLRHGLAQRGVLHARGRSWQATMDQLIDYYRLATRVFQCSQVRRRRLAGAV
jgi:glycosyltransferase involved in cell wall biosynthesis